MIELKDVDVMTDYYTNGELIFEEEYEADSYKSEWGLRESDGSWDWEDFKWQQGSQILLNADQRDLLLAIRKLQEENKSLAEKVQLLIKGV